MIERYTRPAMGAIWSLENRYRTWLEVEVAACEGWAELGRVPREAVAEIRAKARVDVDRILAIEAEIHHDVIAFTTAIAEQVGDAAKYIHYGLTSTDVVDTAQGLQVKQASELLLQGLDRLRAAIAAKARAHKHTVQIGRTHGVHAEPITFGLKLANWYAECGRNRERLERAAAQLAVGKLSGSVGNFAHVEPSVEEYVCRRLGLGVAPISTQTLSRDRHAEYLAALAILAGSLEKFATEIRGLQRTETREVEEPFRAGQKGSSSMPHKRNPEKCERICGLARLVRGYALAALEDQPLWHERDISHSSVERVILPDATILVDYMLDLLAGIVEGLHVYPGRMEENLERTGGLVFSQRVLLALVAKGLSREEAYGIVQGHAMAGWEGEVSFRELLARDERVRRVLSPEELEACFDPRPHLRHVDGIFRRVGLE